ncbi:MAG: extracellular solute-binding protein [Planctomycetota bacterium]
MAILTLAAVARAADEKVTIYVSLDKQHSAKVLDQFEKETGIKVEDRYDTEADKTIGMVRKLKEQKADPVADVYWNNELATTIGLKEFGVLQPYVSPSAKDIPAVFKDPDGYWTGFAARARVLIVNTNLVKPEEYPRSMWDLTKEKWRGKCLMARPQTGTTAAHGAALYSLDPKRADEYFDKLLANDVVWTRGNAHNMKEVSAGRYAFGWTDTDDFNVALQKGWPVALVYPDAGPEDIGVMYIPNSLMLIKGSKNPEAGKKLIDWLLRPEIEAMLAHSATAQIPVRPGVKVPDNVRRPDQVGKVMQLDWNKVGKEYDRWVAHLKVKLSQAEESSPTLYLIILGVVVVAVAVVLFLKKATGEPT